MNTFLSADIQQDSTTLLKCLIGNYQYSKCNENFSFPHQVFRIKPPMCISQADVDFAVGVLDTVFEKACRNM